MQLINADTQQGIAPPTLPVVESASPRPVPTLSAREVEVLLCWILNDAKDDVCSRLYISIGTVNTHLARIRAKYETVGRPAPTKATLLARALQDGHLQLSEL